MFFVVDSVPSLLARHHLCICIIKDLANRKMQTISNLADLEPPITMTFKQIKQSYGNLKHKTSVASLSLGYDQLHRIAIHRV